ncbi:AMIN-like domain-containing (lipo)protein [Saccharothrix xinjiangensis]|uniref:AMIN-like domain-containing protein n=1 Tax=Saccharothrix xinjiangensis TaxID=204798 RepID=A0ABV9XSJ8_9PSEU
MLRKVAVVLAAAVAVAVPAAVVAPAVASAAVCETGWGSGSKSQWPVAQGVLTNIRSGQHECYDRLVFDFAGVNDGYWVQYVDEVVQEGSGKPVPLRGGGKLQITVGSPAYDENGSTYVPANRSELVDVTGYATFRQAAWAGSFEGQTTVGLGVRAVLPFRVFTLPGRVVVDVAHSW